MFLKPHIGSHIGSHIGGHIDKIHFSLYNRPDGEQIMKKVLFYFSILCIVISTGIFVISCPTPNSEPEEIAEPTKHPTPTPESTIEPTPESTIEPTPEPTIKPSPPSDPESIQFLDQNLKACVIDAIKKITGVYNQDIYLTDALKITTLNCHEKEINYLNGIEYLTNLTELNLGDNNIQIISAIEGLTNLNILSLKNNTIFNFTPLS